MSAYEMTPAFPMPAARPESSRRTRQSVSAATLFYRLATKGAGHVATALFEGEVAPAGWTFIIPNDLTTIIWIISHAEEAKLAALIQAECERLQSRASKPFHGILPPLPE